MGRVSGGASWINISNVTGASCIDDISVWGEFAWGEFVLGRHVQSPTQLGVIVIARTTYNFTIINYMFKN